MSVLIRGMEMPKPKLADMATVYDAYILVSPNGHATIVVDNEDGMDSTEYPLASVPPHGDLIDRGELLKDKQHYEYMSDEFYVTVRDIEEAPTIVPAEPPKGET